MAVRQRESLAPMALTMLYSLSVREEMQETPGLDTRLFYDAFKASPIGIALEDMEGQPVFVNPALCSMLGFNEQEMCSMHCVNFSPPEDAQKDWALFEQLRARSIDHYQIEKRFSRRDGSFMWGRLSVSLLSEHPSPLVVAMVEDITERKRAEETLRESEEKFRSVFRDAGIGMVIVSPEGRFLGANGSFCEALGYTQEELLTKSVEALTLPEDWPVFSQRLRAALNDGRGFYRVEKRCLHKSGRIVYTESSGSVIRNGHGDPQYFVGEVLDVTKRKEAEETIASINRRLVEAQEAERARIARDLHDDVNQRIALAATDIEKLKQEPPSSTAELQHRLSDVWQQLIAVSTGVQSISHQLHSPQLEYLGVVAAIRSFCRDFAARTKVEIDFKSEGVPNHVAHDVSLCLFRIAQEALQNATKHSQVRHFAVVLSSSGSQLHLTVSDRGIGFDANSPSAQTGLGLISMRERVRLVNGAINIESKRTGGTTIHVHVPLESEYASQRAV
jgi:PAS domain S-box-containing protein